ERVVRRFLGARRCAARRRAGHAEHAAPDRVLQGPLAQRPVLPGEDRVPRARHALPFLTTGRRAHGRVGAEIGAGRARLLGAGHRRVRRGVQDRRRAHAVPPVAPARRGKERRAGHRRRRDGAEHRSDRRLRDRRSRRCLDARRVRYERSRPHHDHGRLAAIERRAIAPRADWQAKAEAVGMIFHHTHGEVYWNESAHYRLTSADVELIETATNELWARCLDAVEHVVTKRRYAELAIPDAAVPLIETSWNDDHPSIYGR